MFVKGVYNSFRSPIALASQLILPFLFVLIGLILARTLPNLIGNDPKRSLDLRTSAISPDNVTLFFAQFGDIPLDPSMNLTFNVNNNVSVLGQTYSWGMNLSLPITSQMLLFRQTSAWDGNIEIS